MKFENLYIECENLEQRAVLFMLSRTKNMGGIAGLAAHGSIIVGIRKSNRYKAVFKPYYWQLTKLNLL